MSIRPLSDYIIKQIYIDVQYISVIAKYLVKYSLYSCNVFTASFAIAKYLVKVHLLRFKLLYFIVSFKH